MPTRASQSGIYCPPKKTIRFGSASAFKSHLLTRLPEEFPAPRQRAFVKGKPSCVFDQTAQCSIDAALRRLVKNTRWLALDERALARGRKLFRESCQEV